MYYELVVTKEKLQEMSQSSLEKMAKILRIDFNDIQEVVETEYGIQVYFTEYSECGSMFRDSLFQVKAKK